MPSRFWPLAAYGAVLAAGATGAAWSAYIFIREVMQRLHPMTFIAFVFLVIGLAVASAGLRGLRRVLSGTKGPAPATGVVPSDGNPKDFWTGVLWLNAFTSMVVACMAYAFMHVSDAFARVVVAILGVAFGWSGIAYALMAKRKSREWESFGETTLRISPHVAQTGAPLEGTIAFERGVAPGAAFNVILVCQKAARHSDFPATLWQREVEALAVRGASGVEIRFTFELPAHLPASGDVRGTSNQWRLDLQGDFSGSILDRSFTLHVARGAQRAAQTDSPAGSTPAAARETQDLQPAMAKVPAALARLQTEASGFNLEFVPTRGLRFGAGMIVVGVVVIGIALAVAVTFAEVAASLYMGFIALLGLGMAVAGAHFAWSRLTVRARGGQVQVTRVSALGRRSRVIPASRIEAILPALQYAITRDLPGRWNNTYSIRLGLDTGELVTIADGIKGASVATDLCERFASALRLDRGKVASIEHATTNVQRFKQARSTRRSPPAQQETP